MDIDTSKLPKEITDKYQITDNTFKVAIKPDVKDLVEVEIGDSKTPAEFLPQQKVQRWDNECNVSLRLVHDEKTPVVTTVGDTIKWTGDKIEAHFYDIQDAEHLEGASEFEVVLKEKPLTNVVEFTLVDKDVDYFYQPALTPEEIVQGSVRPENVVGSYAVYAKTPKTNWTGGKEYKTGKIGQIYRPKIIDSAGTEVWGELHIENGILSVTIPQDFLDKAVYPVRRAAGLTFGYTTIPTYATTGPSVNTAYATRFTSPASINTVSKLTLYGYRNPSSNIKGLIVDSSKNLIANGVTDAAAIPTTGNWFDATFSTPPTLSANTTYGLGWVNQSASGNFPYDQLTNTTNYDTANSYTTPENLGATTDVTRTYGIYATYTASGEVVAGPVSTLAFLGVG